MQKMLISIPDKLAARMRTAIPKRQRSKIIAELLEGELCQRERQLYACALAVEQDKALQKELSVWDVTIKDGLTDESW